MTIARLAHYSIRSNDLAASRRFYTEVMGLRVGFRPPFDFPGIWLYLGDDESEFGVVHIIGADPNDSSGLSAYLGDRGAKGGTETGAVDHIAFLAEDWPTMRQRCLAADVDFVERTVPLLGLRQVFIVDPSGVTIELNYPAVGA